LRVAWYAGNSKSIGDRTSERILCPLLNYMRFQGIEISQGAFITEILYGDDIVFKIYIISTSRKGLNMVNLVLTKETQSNVQAQCQDYPNNLF
jgi:hypothetical protein